MSCKLCLEFNENSFEFSSDVAIEKNILEILRKHFPFCFKDNDYEGFVCEKCWWKVEIFDNFHSSIELLHQNTIFADALIKFNQDNQLNEQEPNISVCRVEEPDCVLTEQQSSVTELIASENDDIDNPRNYRYTIPRCGTQKRLPSKQRHLDGKKHQIQCDLCDHTTTIPKMKTHKRLVHAEAENVNSSVTSTQPIIPQGHVTTYQCTEPDCPKKRLYTTQFQLHRHMRDKHCEIQCDLCHKTYRRYYLPKHKKNVHSNHIETVCDICGMGCKTKESYKAHYATMHTTQEKVQCDICKMWLKNKYYFRGHYITIHLDSNPVTCLICGHTAPNKKALDSHTRTHRPDYKSFLCTVCGKGFSSSTRQREHTLVHSNARQSHKCSNCLRSFSSKSGLRRHMCTKPAERNFKCPYCDRTYSYISGVRSHVGRSHRAEEDTRKATIKMKKLANLEKLKNNLQPN